MPAPELWVSEAMSTLRPGCLRMPESMLVALGAHARLSLECARQRRPRWATRRDGGAHPPRTRPTCRSSSGCRTGCGGCLLPPWLSWTGVGAPPAAVATARGSVLAHPRRADWGAGGGLYHSPPGGDPPLSLPMTRARGLRGPGPEGPPPLRICPAGARLRQLHCLFIYFRCVLHVAMATAPSFPASVGHRCFQTLLGQRQLRGCVFCLCGESRMYSPYSGPFYRDTLYPAFPARQWPSTLLLEGDAQLPLISLIPELFCFLSKELLEQSYSSITLSLCTQGIEIHSIRRFLHCISRAHSLEPENYAL